jgi:hypothetical protein
MSTSPVSTTSLYQELQQYFQSRQSDLQQLGQDLTNGNTTAAETDVQDIAQLGLTGPFANGAPFANSQREQDFTTIGQALQSGNLSAAQQAFSNLEATFQKASPVGPTPVTTGAEAGSGAGSSGGSTGPAIVLNVPNTGSGPDQVTINIANQASGGEQVSLSIGQGSNAQQVSFNLGANTNEEIILNFLGESSTPTTSGSTATGSSSPSSGLSVSA